MKRIEKRQWGAMASGEAIDLFTLRSADGIEAAITNYGGRIVALETADRDGRFDDIVLGFDELEGYLHKNPYFGALIGRYGNRIANARFTLEGRTYELARNDGQNSLHGGLKGFDKVAWKAREVESDGTAALELQYVSVDGEDGYPGTLTATVRYALGENDLRIEYEATTDAATVLNLTNHSYFDLGGQGANSVLDHEVTLHADAFTPVNEHLIPTGELQPVRGTPFDFTSARRVGDRIQEDDEQLHRGIGYDHNFVLNGESGGLRAAARVEHRGTGRVLEVHTTQPGIQFYTGNHLDGTVRGKGGVVYGFRSGFCLETQHFPDSPNQPSFPSTALHPGERFRSTTIFRFLTA